MYRVDLNEHVIYVMLESSGINAKHLLLCRGVIIIILVIFIYYFGNIFIVMQSQIILSM